MSNANEVDVAAIFAKLHRATIGQRVYWDIEAIVVQVKALASAERALVGTRLDIVYEGPVIKNLAMQQGILFRCTIPLDDANKALDTIATGATARIDLRPSIIRPMAEACVRVPISLLKELRGQEIGADLSRQALVRFWGDERHT